MGSLLPKASTAERCTNCDRLTNEPTGALRFLMAQGARQLTAASLMAGTDVAPYCCDKWLIQ